MWPDMEDDANEDCLLAERFATSIPIKLIMYIQLLFAIAIFIAAFTVARQLYTNPPAFHCNFTILILSLLVYSTIYSVTCIVTTVFTQFEYSFYDSPCELLFKSWIPVLVRAPIYFYVHGIAFLHVVLFFERLTATYFCHAYETAAGKGCGIFATAVLWTVSGGCFFYAFCGDDFTKYRTFISATSPHNASRVFTICVLCTFLDLSSIVMDYLLYRHNKHMQDNSNVTKWQKYRLRRNYQLRENERTVHMLLFLSIMHSGIYLTYSALNLLIRVQFENGDPVLYITLLEGCLNIISIHALTMLGILHYYLRFARHKRKFIVEDAYMAKDLYFIQFKQQLEGINPNGPAFVFP